MDFWNCIAFSTRLLGFVDLRFQELRCFLKGDKLMKTEKCPKCGKAFDPEQDTIIECPCCHEKGSTACCNVGGRNCPCNECECECDKGEE
jgi:hypothetical protein